MNEEIKRFVNETIENHSLVRVNDQLYLKQYQIELLDSYHIDYKKCSSVNDILMFIDHLLEDEEVEDYELLDELAKSLQEFHYYHYTNK